MPDFEQPNALAIVRWYFDQPPTALHPDSEELVPELQRIGQLLLVKNCRASVRVSFLEYLKRLLSDNDLKPRQHEKLVMEVVLPLVNENSSDMDTEVATAFISLLSYCATLELSDLTQHQILNTLEAYIDQKQSTSQAMNALANIVASTFSSPSVCSILPRLIPKFLQYAAGKGSK
jgi:hypothetical protein